MRTQDETAVRLWVREILQRYDTTTHVVQVIYADQQNSARPSLPYATVLKTADSYIGEGRRDYEDNINPGFDAKERANMWVEAAFTVQIYGQGNSQMAQDLRISAISEEVSNFNMLNGIVVVDTNQDPTRLSTNSNGVTEDRTITGYRIRYNRDFVTDVKYTIETVIPEIIT